MFALMVIGIVVACIFVYCFIAVIVSGILEVRRSKGNCYEHDYYKDCKVCHDNAIAAACLWPFYFLYVACYKFFSYPVMLLSLVRDKTISATKQYDTHKKECGNKTRIPKATVNKT